MKILYPSFGPEEAAKEAQPIIRCSHSVEKLSPLILLVASKRIVILPSIEDY
jgi:hypothetical protein